MSQVVLASSSDRSKGLKSALEALRFEPVQGREVLIKPNFNTADPCPGSTDNETLITLIDSLWELGAGSISLGERSYPPTREVIDRKGVAPILKERDVRLLDFDRLSEKDWIVFNPPGSHWPEGFRVARPVVEADYLVEACCLKTHQYGGVFTMSLKLAVGTVPTGRNGFRYMDQLHSSPHQRRMIAEINTAFEPKLVILDGVEAFVDGGPMTGTRKETGVTLTATDRVALDAVGVAVLKIAGSNRAIMEPMIFDQEQLARAAELGLGVSSVQEIELTAADESSLERVEEVAAILTRG